jgi:O-antigen/teichoic acid export membrane protein
VLIAAASLILAPFGPEYVSAGAPVLRLLACASAFRSVGAVYVAICRVEGRAGRILAMQACVFVLVTGGTLLLGRRHGIDGVALAWLIANAIVGCVVLPSVWRTARTR